MEVTTLSILIILGIILLKDQPMFANAFFLVAGGFSLGGITLNTIQEITGTTITYVTVEPIISYAIGFIFIVISLLGYLDLIDYGRRVQNAKNEADYSKP